MSDMQLQAKHAAIREAPARNGDVTGTLDRLLQLRTRLQEHRRKSPDLIDDATEELASIIDELRSGEEALRIQNERFAIAARTVAPHLPEQVELSWGPGEHLARFAADVSSLLAESMDYEATLSAVARYSVPFLAELCVIDVVDEDNVLRVAAAHSDPAFDSVLLQLRVLKLDALACAATVSGIVTEASSAAELRRPEAENGLLWQMGVRSLLSIPLVANKAVLGRLILGSDRDLSERRAVAADIAHRIALSVQQSRLLQQAQAASQAKSHFIGVISHEFRTPLTSIIGFTEIMLMNPDTDNQREQLVRVQSSAWHLVGLIDEILTFARTEAGREVVLIQSQDIADLVQRTVSIIEPLAQPKGVVVDVVISSDNWVLGTDSGKFRQILFNLLTNAIKFTEQGTVSVALSRTDTEMQCVIQDTGIGIPPEYLEKIFEPFWQVDQSNTRLYGGSGLGLSVTRRLARLLGGDVLVDSTRTLGSRFTLRLPVRSPDAE